MLHSFADDDRDSEGDSSSALIRVRQIAGVFCLLLAAFGLWRGTGSLFDAGREQALAHVAAPSKLQPVDVAESRTGIPLAGMRIDQVDVGQWVLAENPLEADDLELGIEVVPDEWRLLELRAPKTDGSYADVKMLRPVWWLEQQWRERHHPQVIVEVVLSDEAGQEASLLLQLDDHRDLSTGQWLEKSPYPVPAYEEQALVGGTLEIHVPECGIEGNAHVLAIKACPQLAPRPGPEFRTVTATFHHHAATVLDVAVSGLPGAIGTTPNHPFWSEDRQDFIRADQLRAGEQVRLADGTPRPVAAITRRALPEDVFNLEVQVEHTYHVSTGGVLVHNSWQCFEQGVRTFTGTMRREFLGAASGTRRIADGASPHGFDLAVEAKWINNWKRSIYNAARGTPRTAAKLQEVVSQMEDYSATFRQVDYYTNSADMQSHLRALASQLRLRNVTVIGPLQ